MDFHYSHYIRKFSQITLTYQSAILRDFSHITHNVLILNFICIRMIIYTNYRHIVGIKKTIKYVIINNSPFGGKVCSDICPQTFDLF